MTRPVDRAIVVSASAAVTDATAAAKRAFKVAHDNRSSTAVTRADLQAVARHCRAAQILFLQCNRTAEAALRGVFKELPEIDCGHVLRSAADARGG
jgi:hypothetical protein